jgi:ankyrin repeat protein
VNAADNYGYTSLMYASAKGRVEVVRALLAAGAGVIAADNTGETALICASEGGHVEVVRALLAASANQHLISLSGHTAYSVSSNTPSLTAAIRAQLDLAP